MRAIDAVQFSWRSISAARMRAWLMLLAMSIGVGSVVVLTALADGARRYVVNEFASLGTNLVIVLPGRVEAGGGAPFMLVGETTRDLTLDDALAIARHPHVRQVAPLNIGAAPVSWSDRERDIAVLGSTAELLTVRHWSMAQGEFLPPGGAGLAQPVAVLGAKVKRELFGAENPLGAWVRLGDRRLRVIGVLGSEGRSIGVDVEDVVIVPVATSAQMFNTPSLFRILVEASDNEAIPQVIEHIRATIRQRHQGEEDVTVVTQDAVLATFDRILRAFTFAVAGIAGISLSVAGILIMNIMLVAVAQRRAEVGLLKALGSDQRTIHRLFLLEAAMLSLLGAFAGLGVGYAASFALAEAFPALPVVPPAWAVVAAVVTALISGLVFGVLPARRAARLDPVSALARR